MSDPNEQFTRGLHGQAPPAGGTDLDRWREGKSIRDRNSELLGGPGATTGSLGGADTGPELFQYTAPPDPRILRAGLFMAASFIVFCLCVPIFGTLYPIATGGGLAAALVADGFLRHSMPGWDGSDRLPVSMLAGVVVFWIASRLDHRAAAYVPPYRWLRHAARVILIALLIPVASLNPQGSLVPTAPWQVHAIVTNPAFLPFVAVMAVVAHVGLRKLRTIRGEWDRGLEFYRLRPKGLPD